jgi:predicted ferric reductase
MSIENAAGRFKSLLVPLVCVVTLLIPVSVWFLSIGNPFAYLTHYVPPGQTLFAISKLCALLGFALLWFQSMTALARFAPALRGFLHLGQTQHIWLGVTTVILIATHVALFITAGTLRTGHLTIGLLLPRFDQGFYNTHIAFGAVALWLLLIAIVAGVLRARGLFQVRWVHCLVFAVFALGLLHGTAIGSESRFGLMRYVYAFIGLSLGTAICSVIWLEIRRAVQRRAAERMTTAQ